MVGVGCWMFADTALARGENLHVKPKVERTLSDTSFYYRPFPSSQGGAFALSAASELNVPSLNGGRWAVA